MATQDDLQASVQHSTAEFLRDVDKLRQLEAMDRAQLAAAFERQARKLMEEEVRPRIERILQELVKSKMAPPAPAARAACRAEQRGR